MTERGPRERALRASWDADAPRGPGEGPRHFHEAALALDAAIDLLYAGAVGQAEPEVVAETDFLRRTLRLAHTACTELAERFDNDWRPGAGPRG